MLSHINKLKQHFSSILMIGVLVISSIIPQIVEAQIVEAQIVEVQNISDARIVELQNLAIRLEHSINPESYPCENYYDYVCSRNRPLFSVLGHQPEISQLIQLLTEIQDDTEHFAAKQKLMDYFISCNTLKSIEDCYRESFEYFKPVFGYIITKNHIEVGAADHRDFLDVLKSFVQEAEKLENYQRNPIRLKLVGLKEKFRTPKIFFRPSNLDREYADLRIYRESYQHNLRSLEQYRKRNSTFEQGVQRNILDWSLYVYQSRDKPMSYYYSTLNVHLWMTIFNNTARSRDFKQYNEIAECLKLKQFVNVIDEARLLAVIYLKSFRNAWQNYNSWISSNAHNKDIFEQERKILNPQQLFFTLYAQNFCDFGQELAENVFYLGLKQNQDFYDSYSCNRQADTQHNCI